MHKMPGSPYTSTLPSCLLRTATSSSSFASLSRMAQVARDYIYVIVSPNPNHGTLQAAGGQARYFIKIGKHDGWDFSLKRYTTDNPSIWYRSIEIVRPLVNNVTPGDLFGSDAGKAIQAKVFPNVGGYNLVPDTEEWYETTARANQVANLVAGWEAHWVLGQQHNFNTANILGRGAGYQPTLANGTPGTHGAQFNYRMAVAEYFRRVL
ncbi:hypothetical protein DFH08DRAFT_932423 [Mycena albidolilacea]|uniref:Uncharacterized protein n=1 Tax=Mycena albidolilacea TaxID=1033008 RepID=A0AAD7AGQ8_9AGAR|nr:hypothetical protein DFH08DRAFT_932423 [Mycena albidolilacea]